MGVQIGKILMRPAVLILQRRRKVLPPAGVVEEND